MTKDSILPLSITIGVFGTALSIAFFARENPLEVPALVQAAFDARYPEAKRTKWEQDSNGFFEANFESNDGKFRADFQVDGTWVETEKNVKKKSLPKPILDAIDERYPHLGKIAEIELVQHHRKGLFYDVEFHRGGKNYDIELRPDGHEVIDPPFEPNAR